MLKQFARVSLNHTRSFKSNLKIKWIKPQKFSCINPIKSGDLELKPVIPKETPIRMFKGLEEVKTANEAVKNLCSIGFNGNKHEVAKIRHDLVKRVQRHQYDNSSMEVRIALMTGRIRCYQTFIEKFPMESCSKVLCKELIDKRKKYLKYLRRWDYKRFEWLLEKLSLEFKPMPSFIHWVTRKESLVKLTDLHCAELKQKKLEEYKQVLIAQREKLLKEFDFEQEEIDHLATLQKLSDVELEPIPDKIYGKEVLVKTAVTN